MYNETRYTLSSGAFGQKLTLHGPWNDELYETCRALSVTDLELNSAKGWTAKNLGFIRQLEGIEALSILSLDVSDVEAILSLRKWLRYLNLTTYTSEGLDFSVLENLEECRIEWNWGFETLFNVKNLRVLLVNRLPKKHVDELGGLINLTDLSLLSCSAQSLGSLRTLTDLRRLRLALCSALEDCLFLDCLRKLEVLWIQKCKGFRSLEPIGNLRLLQRLVLEGSGPYESLKPLSDLRNLKVLVLKGRKKEVLDGNYDIVSSIVNLEVVEL